MFIITDPNSRAEYSNSRNVEEWGLKFTDYSKPELENTITLNGSSSKRLGC